MRILTNYEDLTGKTISFVHAAQFAEAITIATTNNEVIIMNREIDDDSCEGNLRVFPEFRVLEYIKKEDNRYVRESLAQYAGFDIDEYNRQKKEELLKKQNEWNIEREKRERDEFERLSKIYRNKQVNKECYNTNNYSFYNGSTWSSLDGTEKIYGTNEMIEALTPNQLAYVVNNIGYRAHVTFDSKNELVWMLPKEDYRSEFYIDPTDNELKNELLWIIK
ncbi:hypothetical protein [Paenibacillus polymyxa]|uniref:hypothetical protein n=1 Tax=Paenibacillus polymyxa TaxID=1406 RepID=UPI0039BC7D90